MFTFKHIVNENFTEIFSRRNFYDVESLRDYSFVDKNGVIII
jgi:hypothetical protein